MIKTVKATIGKRVFSRACINKTCCLGYIQFCEETAEEKEEEQEKEDQEEDKEEEQDIDKDET